MVHYFHKLLIIILYIDTTHTQNTTNEFVPIDIFELTVDPPLVANCTKLELTCSITSNSFSNLKIWWTFDDQNITNGDIIESYIPFSNISKLSIECASLQLNDGSFACNAQHINDSQLIDSKQINVQIYLPVEITLLPNNGTIEQTLDSNVKLICKVNAFPKTTIKWKKFVGNETLLVEDDGRIISEYHEIDETTQQSILRIESLKRSDNGSYVCDVSNEYDNNSQSIINLVVFETPEIHFDRIEIQNTRTAVVYWSLAYDGNLQIDRIELQIRNYSLNDSDWVTREENIVMNSSQSFRVNDLQPGANYGFRLAAINSLGRSEWESMNTTMPADVPSKITEVHVFAKTNETLLIGWKRPAFDNGAQISQYYMTIRDTNDMLVSNQTLDISSGSVQTRNNYMMMFPNLQPGSHYNFQVKACSAIGCGQWSHSLDAVTADGHADAPRNIRLKCYYDSDKNLNNATVLWDSPDNARGFIVGYNVSLEGFSSYRNSDNKIVIDHFKEAYEVLGNQTLEFNVIIKPNTNYSVRLCTINKSGCGLLSHITTSTMCHSSATTPSIFPSDIKLERVESESSRQLRLFLPRISERNGSIKCYKVIIIRLPKNSNASDVLPSSPTQINITTYSQTHSNIDSHDSVGAYIAEEFSSDTFTNHIVIGDGSSTKCYSNDDNRSPRRITSENESALSLSTNSIFDGTLHPNTNYTGFIEVSVLGLNNTLIVKQSQYLEPIQTSEISSIIPEYSETSFVIFFSSLSDSANGILFGTICGLLLVLVLLSSVLCFLKRKANETSSSDDERMGLTSLIRRTVGGHRNGHIPNHINLNSVASVQKWVSAPIPIHNLSTIFQERHANSDFLFQAEFEALPENFSDRTTVSSDAPENMGKNRYPDIKSYDQTRVKLSTIDDIPGSDYINADFVKGYKGRKVYICAQGPIQKTVVDFWRLIYEQKCSVIVMLTGIEEQGRIKCCQYWNEDQPKEISNLYRVTLKSVRKYSDYIIRRFTLENLDESSEKRDILQFHFIMWKDFLAPEQPSWLLRFIKRVNEHYCSDKGPLLVHCSAGVGRTGTFIAIDSLIPVIHENSTHINIFECVSQLRYQRNYLVQSIKQYIFVYRAVMEFIEFGDTEIEICHMKDHFTQLIDHKFEGNISGIVAEFEKLNEVIEDIKSCVVGTMDMNRNKNRYDFIIPYDINRVILTPSPAKDHSYYINASFVQGYDHLLSFIVTQDPLEHTVNEFWWMIAEHSVSTLVMLAELGDGQSKCHCYWPTEEFDCDFVKVKFVQEDITQYYIKRVFSVTQKKSNDCQIVTQFQFLSWKSGVVPESTISLINLIDSSLSNNSSYVSPIVVHCSGGGDRSSVFVAFASLIQQIRREERVDVFQTARYTRSQRHCMLQSIAQYDFLYRCVIDYIELHNLCDTGDTQL